MDRSYCNLSLEASFLWQQSLMVHASTFCLTADTCLVCLHHYKLLLCQLSPELSKPYITYPVH
jgi:hypothetical protein